MSLERHTRHAHYNLNYHMVFVPKYRRKVLQDKVAERLTECFELACAERDWVIHGLEVMPDHVHVFVSVPPKWSPADIAKILKGTSARWLLKDFPQLKANGHLWTNAYYAGTAGAVSSAIIQRYIAAQTSKQVT